MPDAQQQEAGPNVRIGLVGVDKAPFVLAPEAIPGLEVTWRDSGNKFDAREAPVLFQHPGMAAHYIIAALPL